jgi:hypothetical protein
MYCHAATDDRAGEVVDILVVQECHAAEYAMSVALQKT